MIKIFIIIFFVFYQNCYSKDISNKVSDEKKYDLNIETNTNNKKIKNPSIGDGAIKMVIYTDMYCHICAKTFDNAKKLQKNIKNVQIILKPIGMLGEVSYDAARYALAFNAQEKFLEFIELMSKIHNHERSITEIKNLNFKQFENDLNDPETIRILERNYFEIRQLKKEILTPTIIVLKDNKIVVNFGYASYEKMLKLLQQQ